MYVIASLGVGRVWLPSETIVQFAVSGYCRIVDEKHHAMTIMVSRRCLKERYRESRGAAAGREAPFARLQNGRSTARGLVCRLRRAAS